MKSLLVGSLLIGCQLGCGGSPKAGPRQAQSPSPSSQANISISPASAIVGSTDLTVTITASKTFSFAGGHIWENRVLWSVNGNDTELFSTLISSSQLTAIVPAALLTSPVQAELHVEIWDHIEGTRVATSSSAAFTVTLEPVPSPSISSISPST
ncbi:MAG TPA: hypothetical protein VFV92_03955, partial [Candidatus Bathyarchaeia archaeon]|nr:hypothetical protein [Candidatus Bathyarchaeia archaeon]